MPGDGKWDLIGFERVNLYSCILLVTFITALDVFRDVVQRLYRSIHYFQKSVTELTVVDIYLAISYPNTTKNIKNNNLTHALRQSVTVTAQMFTKLALA
jgi:hypothetical protein